MAFVFNQKHGRWEWRDDQGKVLFVMESPSATDVKYFQQQASLSRQ